MPQLNPGDRIKTASGKSYQVDRLIGSGSQADVYLLNPLRGEARMVFKRFGNRDELIRVKWLHRQRFPADLPMCLPVEIVEEASHAGYVTGFVNGEPLSDFFAREDLSYGDTARTACALMRSLAAIHQYMAHGDVREENIFIRARRSAMGEWVVERIIFIDGDNYAAPGGPEPLYLGDHLVMAPELRASRDSRLVSRSADVYAAAQLCHRMLLRHDDASFVETPEQFDSAMLAGYWHSDIYGGHRRRDTGLKGQGLPADMLDKTTASLFRAALQANPALRPSARQFANHLEALLEEQRIINCPCCDLPLMLEPGVTHCSHKHVCGKPLPRPFVVLPGGRRLSVDGALVLGREQLGNELVSRRHLLLRRAGPLVCVSDLGSANGTRVRTAPGAPWQGLAPRSQIYLTPTPRESLVRAAGVELGLVF